jgi:hypothetical protein
VDFVGFEKDELSWTISQVVAERFARGNSLRTYVAPNSIILVDKCHKEDILSKFDGMIGFELLCRSTFMEKKVSLEQYQLVAL